jgi:chitin disaccharide deacetylase
MILCADDYGLREDINRASLELVNSGRLSAVSCMTGLARCTAEDLSPLVATRGSVDLGLHLCLTSEGPLTPPAWPAFGTLIRRALRRQLDPAEVARTVSEQYQLFVQKCGFAPDYIDGHLHAHQLPGVRDGLLRFLRSLPAGSRPYVRNTRLPLAALIRRGLPWTKAAFIGWFGSRLIAALRAEGIPTNTGFAGIYDFKQCARYRGYAPRFVDCLSRPNGILVTHPGEDEDWRRAELATWRAYPFAPGTLNRFQQSTRSGPA